MATSDPSSLPSDLRTGQFAEARIHEIKGLAAYVGRDTFMTQSCPLGKICSKLCPFSSRPQARPVRRAAASPPPPPPRRLPPPQPSSAPIAPPPLRREGQVQRRRGGRGRAGKEAQQEVEAEAGQSIGGVQSTTEKGWKRESNGGDFMVLNQRQSFFISPGWRPTSGTPSGST